MTPKCSLHQALSSVSLETLSTDLGSRAQSMQPECSSEICKVLCIRTLTDAYFDWTALAGLGLAASVSALCSNPSKGLHPSRRRHQLDWRTGLQLAASQTIAQQLQQLHRQSRPQVQAGWLGLCQAWTFSA